MDERTWAVILIVLAINFAFAVYAGGVAEEKGYIKGNWIAACFFFGIVGYILLAALPDRDARAMLKRIEIKLSTNGGNATFTPLSDSTSQKKTSAADTWNTKGEWKCPQCGTLNQGSALHCKDCGYYK